MTGLLQGECVLVVGRGSGIARAVTVAARDAGAKVIAAGRDKDALAAAYAGEPAIRTETVDLTDETSIAALGGTPRSSARTLGLRWARSAAMLWRTRSASRAPSPFP